MGKRIDINRIVDNIPPRKYYVDLIQKLDAIDAFNKIQDILQSNRNKYINSKFELSSNNGTECILNITKLNPNDYSEITIIVYNKCTMDILDTYKCSTLNIKE